MSLVVAIGTEFDDYDAEIYRVLLEILLKIPITRWPTQMKFNGDRSVRKLIDPYLRSAAESDVRHGLIAIDNDGARRHPEHKADHDPVTEAKDQKSGCRTCWLHEAIPAWWRSSGNRVAIAVAVQTMETWLLVLRGDSLEPSPEQVYHRPTLKKRFFGPTPLPVAERSARALKQVTAPRAVERLRELESFKRFEAEIAEWAEV